MIPKAIESHLNESNRALLDDAAQVKAATDRASAIRDLKKRLEAAAADGQLDPAELAELEATAKQLGIGDETAAIFEALRGRMAGGAVDTSEVASELSDLEQAIGDAFSGAMDDARPTLEMQMHVEAEQIGMQMLSATMMAYHRTAQNIIANMKA